MPINVRLCHECLNHFQNLKILIFDNDKILSSLHTIYKNITQMNDKMHYIIMQDSRLTEIICQKLNDKLLSCYERVSFLLKLKEKNIIKKNIVPWINV